MLIFDLQCTWGEQAWRVTIDCQPTHIKIHYILINNLRFNWSKFWKQVFIENEFVALNTYIVYCSAKNVGHLVIDNFRLRAFFNNIILKCVSNFCMQLRFLPWNPYTLRKVWILCIISLPPCLSFNINTFL